jgi:hypothetical protein
LGALSLYRQLDFPPFRHPGHAYLYRDSLKAALAGKAQVLTLLPRGLTMMEGATKS